MDTDFSRRLATAGRGVDVEALWPLVVRYCRARIGRVDGEFSLADGVARDVCSAVLAGPRRGSLPAFVYSVAVREVGRALRGLDGVVVRDPLAGRMAELIEALPEQQREIVVLRVVVGLSAEEVGEAVGMTTGAVRVVQHRAMTELRRISGAK